MHIDNYSEQQNEHEIDKPTNVAQLNRYFSILYYIVRENKTKVSLNMAVLPTKTVAKAHSFMLDLKYTSVHSVAVGEFGNSFELNDCH